MPRVKLVYQVLQDWMVRRDSEGSLESLVPQVRSVLKVLEGRVVSWASQDPRETRETWVHLDHLVLKVSLENWEGQTGSTVLQGPQDLQDQLAQQDLRDHQGLKESQA